MQTLYNIATKIAEKLVPFSRFLSEKMKLFVEGRKNVFPLLESEIQKDDKVIWIHAASLGEYEQAVPVIENLKISLPSHKILVTFFSPSGFEVKKNSKLPDLITYLPLDTKDNVNRFLDVVRPECALFIKYEFWPNFLSTLKTRKIKTLLISGSFRKDQIFFKAYGKWMQNYLQTFHHFFLQNDESAALLTSIGFNNITVSGDTRFDRVNQQLKQDNTLSSIEEFKNNKTCIVAGSTWPEDEDLLLDFINSSKEVKFIIAPHTIKQTRIQQLVRKLQKENALYSEREHTNLSLCQVLIIDNIGLLSKIYSYADIAYVGGAAGETGLHNILEPATFGVPIVIGKNYSKFPEAQKLKELGGLFSVSSEEQVTTIFRKLSDDRNFRDQIGSISKVFIRENTGATEIIMDYIHKNL